jgi:HlyD family secretion protein
MPANALSCPRTPFAILVLGVATFSILSSGARAQNAHSPFSARGRVEAANGILPIGTAATATVREVLVREGARVQAGQLLVTLDCRPIEADLQARAAQLAAAEAVLNRVRNGARPDEIAVGVAAVGYSTARAEEAQKTFERTQALHEGVTVTKARVLETQRDARISAAQLEEARAKLALLRAGSREEDVTEAHARRNAAAAQLTEAQARLEQCSVRAPVDGTVVETLATPGQLVSAAIPVPLVKMVQDGGLRVRAELPQRDRGRIFVGQSASVTVDGSREPALPAQVESLGPIIRLSATASGASAGAAEAIQPVILKLDGDGPPLPIGLEVKVQFDPPKG